MVRIPGVDDGVVFGPRRKSGIRIPTADELGFFEAPATPHALDFTAPAQTPAQTPETAARELPNAVVDAVMTTTDLLDRQLADFSKLPGATDDDPTFLQERLFKDLDRALKEAETGARNPTTRALLEQNAPQVRDFLRTEAAGEAAADGLLRRRDAVEGTADTLFGLAARRPDNYDDFARLLGDLIDGQGQASGLPADRLGGLRTAQLKGLAGATFNALIETGRFDDAADFLAEAGDDLMPLDGDEVGTFTSQLTAARADHDQGRSERLEGLRADHLASLAETGTPDPTFIDLARAALDAKPLDAKSLDAKSGAALAAEEARALEQFRIVSGLKHKTPDEIAATVEALRPPPGSTDGDARALFDGVSRATVRLLDERERDPAAAVMDVTSVRDAFEDAAQMARAAAQQPGAEELATTARRHALTIRMTAQRRIGIAAPKVLSVDEAGAQVDALNGAGGDDLIKQMDAMQDEFGVLHKQALGELADAGLEGEVTKLAGIKDQHAFRAFARSIWPAGGERPVAASETQVRTARQAANADYDPDGTADPGEVSLVENRAEAILARDRNPERAGKRAADELRKALGKDERGRDVAAGGAAGDDELRDEENATADDMFTAEEPNLRDPGAEETDDDSEDLSFAGIELPDDEIDRILAAMEDADRAAGISAADQTAADQTKGDLSPEDIARLDRFAEKSQEEGEDFPSDELAAEAALIVASMVPGIGHGMSIKASAEALGAAITAFQNDDIKEALIKGGEAVFEGLGAVPGIGDAIRIPKASFKGARLIYRTLVRNKRVRAGRRLEASPGPTKNQIELHGTATEARRVTNINPRNQFGGPGAYKRKTPEDAIVSTRWPPRGPEENVFRGLAAVDLVIKDVLRGGKGVIPDAMRRADLPNGPNSISFRWGKPGKGKQYKNGEGLSHIIAKHGPEVVEDVLETLARGTATLQQSAKGRLRLRLKSGDNVAFLALDRFGNRETWLLTGFSTREGANWGFDLKKLGKPLFFRGKRK